jgi:pimeloyl-ACP methyl ester carboxylesterase
LLLATVALAQSAGVASTSLDLQTPTGTIHGTLEIPRGPAPFPIALLCAGSGPTDRDGNDSAVKNNSLKLLAEGLAEHGIATLRFDKRGVGASRAAAPREEGLRFDMYVDDAIAWIDQLRRDPRFKGLAVVGHSDGALVGIVAATRVAVDTIVAISGAGRPADDVLLDQLTRQLASQPRALEEARRILGELRAGRTVPKVDAGFAALFRPSVQPYLISWFRYDPTRELAKLTIPVLIVHGTTDLQLNTTEARALTRAKPDARLEIIEGMNHVLKIAPGDAQANLATYTNPTLPLAPELVETVAKFLRQAWGL